MPTITAFENSPDRGKGQARDMRLRWALEEAGQPYDVRLLSFAAMKAPAHLALHPFGQIPTYEEGDLTLFESGAIVFHIAERFPGLLPKDADARARAIMWMFAALNTIEPPIVDRDVVEYFEGGKSWQGERFAPAYEEEPAAAPGSEEEGAAPPEDSLWFEDPEESAESAESAESDGEETPGLGTQTTPPPPPAPAPAPEDPFLR